MLIGRACGRYVFELREMDVCFIASKCDCVQPCPSLQSVVLGCGWYTIEFEYYCWRRAGGVQVCDVRVCLWRCGVVSKRVARCESEGRRKHKQRRLE